MDKNAALFTGHEARELASFEVLYKSYCTLMRSFKGDTFFIEREQFSALLRSRTELLVFAFEGQSIVATAQASLIQTPPTFQVMVNNVVVAPDHQREGLGRALIEHLTTQVKQQWGRVHPLRLFLTNAPSKGNGHFYQKLDFTPRIDDRATVVWEKII